MTQILQLLVQLSWGLGLVSMVVAVVVKLSHLEARVGVTGHTFILLAGTLFLCALATRELQKS